MKQSPARILGVTAGLAAGGALFGALTGAVAITILMTLVGIWGEERSSDFILEAARKGAVLGAVLLPIAGWTLMRRVPLWRALTGTIVGTVVGGVVGAVFFTFLFGLLFGIIYGPTLGAILGFLCAVIGLRRRFSAVSEARRIEVPPRRLDY
jgi:hypothetical protein